MEKVTFKDINDFELKETLDGTEEIQVSSTEKINLKDQLDKTNNLYVADFTIEDLESLSASNSSLTINARALISALAEGKAIGIRQGNNGSMSIASSYKDGRSILLTVISTNGIMYKVTIIDAGTPDPEMEDSETGIIHGGFIQVIPIENPSFVPFSMDTLNGVVDGDREFPFRKETIMLQFLENKPLFITAGSEAFGSGFIPVSYWITKQGGDPTAVDIDIVYNNGLYHIHWDITDDITLYLNKDTVSYTPLSDVYIVTEFTVEDIVDQEQSIENTPQLTISRAFLDAAYRGVPIMVRLTRDGAQAAPITVDRIYNPNEETAIRFNVQFENLEYKVTCSSALVLTGGMTVDATIISHNLVDWNENLSHMTGYIANRTHHLGNRIPFEIGDRFSLENTKGTHYIDNYKLLYDGKLYDLPRPGVKGFISNYFTIGFNGYSESGNKSVYTFTTNQLSPLLPSPTFEICRDLDEGGHKTLDEFYLPDGAKPWKHITATASIATGVYIFKDISDADIANKENVIRNKVIYNAIGKDSISIVPPFTTSILEFKIIAGGAQNISIDGSKPFWENGGKPETSDTGHVIYSFLILGGNVYASAKVYSI